MARLRTWLIRRTCAFTTRKLVVAFLCLDVLLATFYLHNHPRIISDRLSGLPSAWGDRLSGLPSASGDRLSGLPSAWSDRLSGLLSPGSAPLDEVDTALKGILGNGTGTFYHVMGEPGAAGLRYRHLWADPGDPGSVFSPREIAVGMAITTKHPTPISAMSDYPFFSYYLPSFCVTASVGYNYTHYLAHDHNDNMFSKEHFRERWLAAYRNYTSAHCPGGSTYDIHMVSCPYDGKPAWAQNDAMMEAYFRNAAYYYRINDDTRMETAGWTEQYIRRLAAYDPPNVGVVGPNHQGGKKKILTYDFVHRTHIDIFGYYYPRRFCDWYADNWMTTVYEPGRSGKLMNTTVLHILANMTHPRYFAHMMQRNTIDGYVTNSKPYISRYLAATAAGHPKPSGSKVISMGLWGDDQKYTYGAVRNAQLVPVTFPQWILRIYVSFSNKEFLVPPNIIAKLKQLGAEIVDVEGRGSELPPARWRLLITTDPKVTHFLIRDADSRLSKRDSVVVRDWLKSDRPFHCIRDNKAQAERAVTDGLWGGKPQELTNLLSMPWDKLIHTAGEGVITDTSPDITGGKNSVNALLNSLIWPKVKSESFCHDSVSCEKWPEAVKFIVSTDPAETLGDSYGPFGLVSESATAHNISNNRCIQTVT